MNQWSFVAAAYAVMTISVLALVVLSLLAMRSAERDAEAARQKP
jgi:hypothetical protein